MSYSAKIIADSINPVGDRLTTFELTYPRFVHAELMTHRLPEIAWVAYEMEKLYKEKEPVPLSVGEWHLPYVELVDKENPLYVDLSDLEADVPGDEGSNLIKIATARCARVSYLTHDGVRDYSKDIELHDKLSGNGHWSPFEHVAQAMEYNAMSGNFKGWRQYRKTFDNEHAGRALPA